MLNVICLLTENSTSIKLFQKRPFFGWKRPAVGRLSEMKPQQRRATERCLPQAESQSCPVCLFALQVHQPRVQTTGGSPGP